MKKKFFIIILSAVILFTFCINDHTYAKPYINARAVILMDAQTGRILYEKNAYSKVAVASITKLMTAVVAIEECSLDEIVQVGKKPPTISGSKLGIRTGQEIPLRELLIGTIVKSGNDGAIAIAEHCSGTEAEFAKLMNQKANELGMYSSSFANSHGLDSPNHYSTAFDIALLSKHALGIDLIRETVKMKTVTLSYGTYGNTNQLLFSYQPCQGIKTGYTGDAGFCLAAYAEKGEMKLIAVILGTHSKTERYKTSLSLFEYGFNNYKMESLCRQGEFAGSVSVMDGESDYVLLRYSQSFSIPLKQGEKDKIKAFNNFDDTIKAPVSKGEVLGYTAFTLDGNVIAIVPVEADSDVLKKELNIFGKIKNLFKRIFGSGII